MKYIREKLEENPLERIMFYVACAVGIYGGFQIVSSPAELPYKLLATLCCLICVRAAWNLLWWFGDHPEE